MKSAEEIVFIIGYFAENDMVWGEMNERRDGNVRLIGKHSEQYAMLGFAVDFMVDLFFGYSYTLRLKLSFREIAEVKLKLDPFI